MKKKWLSLILGVLILAFSSNAYANTEPVIEPGSGGSYDDGGSGACWWCFFGRS